MKEYTLLSVLSIIIVILVDSKSGVRVLKRKEYYVFLGIILVLMLCVNGYLTAHIVRYDPRFFLGIRFGTIPLEDFLFGFSMVTLSIVFWEYFKNTDKENDVN